jgi:hypothetical protein
LYPFSWDRVSVIIRKQRFPKISVSLH